MAIPRNLPSAPLPNLPVSHQTPQKPGGGSDLLFIFMVIMLSVLVIRMFQSPESDAPVAPFPLETPISTVVYPQNDDAGQTLDSAIIQEAKKVVEPTFVTLGSMDAKAPYRMLVTITNRGAAVSRIELNERAFHDTHDRTGYLGQIIPDERLTTQELEVQYPGVCVQVVGKGTPAEQSGLQVGDRIVAISRQQDHTAPIDSFLALRTELLETKPSQVIQLQVIPNEKIAALAEKTPEAVKAIPPETVTITLRNAPVSILRPEGIVRSYNDYENMRGLLGASSSELDVEQLTGLVPMTLPLGGSEDESLSRRLDSFQRWADLQSGLEETARRGNSDPLSFLMTLSSYDTNEKLTWFPPTFKGKQKRSSNVRLPAVDTELPEVDLRDGYWEYLPDVSNDENAVFRKILLGRKLEVRKTYSLIKGAPPNEKGKKSTAVPEYHLTLKVELVNLDPGKGHKVSYLLDGPSGLPLEGAWYSSGRKTGPGWGLYGLRDLVLDFNHKGIKVIKCADIANDTTMPSDRVSLDFIGVDSQYFQCTMIPQKSQPTDDWHESYAPLRIGSRDLVAPTLTNISFRLKSNEVELAPQGKEGSVLSHEYKIFAGPKKPEVLGKYGLDDTLVYGWFWFVSIPLLAILHFFHNYLVFNYGLAIIMLTILVRLCLFPLSIKQVASTAKMQAIQPLVAAIKEKHKDNPQELMKAQQNLFREHKINPLSGCLPLFLQLPIFIGLYKALSLDVHLYGAPLFTESVRWCSNLAAPDMLVDWSHFWISIGWNGFNMGQGVFYLGPYFNLLPLLTIILFLVQQKFLMPPVVGDDEAAQQQRMMNFMMIFMGFLFFKVPSGLCIYFVASSLWGLLERRFLPKSQATNNIDLAKNTVVPVGSTSRGYESSSSGKYSSRGTSEDRTGKKKRGSTQSSTTTTEPGKRTWRQWMEETLEQAKEQQRLAKSETERRNKQNKRKK